ASDVDGHSGTSSGPTSSTAGSRTVSASCSPRAPVRLDRTHPPMRSGLTVFLAVDWTPQDPADNLPSLGTGHDPPSGQMSSAIGGTRRALQRGEMADAPQVPGAPPGVVGAFELVADKRRDGLLVGVAGR